MEERLLSEARPPCLSVVIPTYNEVATLPAVLRKVLRVPLLLEVILLKSATMEAGGVRFYDRFIVPAARRIESIFTPPIGKNVIVIAQKQ